MSDTPAELPRSSRPDVRNPMLSLTEITEGWAALPRVARLAMIDFLKAISKSARTQGAYHWSKNKYSSASYWMTKAVFARHLANAGANIEKALRAREGHTRETTLTPQDALQLLAIRNHLVQGRPDQALFAVEAFADPKMKKLNAWAWIETIAGGDALSLAAPVAPVAQGQNVTPSLQVKLPALPQAFFDEFGKGADDRIQDYATQAVLADRANEAHRTACDTTPEQEVAALRAELAAIAVATGRSAADGYDVDWHGLAAEVVSSLAQRDQFLTA